MASAEWSWGMVTLDRSRETGYTHLSFNKSLSSVLACDNVSLSAQSSIVARREIVASLPARISKLQLLVAASLNRRSEIMIHRSN